MKKNPYLIILICTIAVLVIEFGIVQFVLKTTRLYPKTEIVLRLESQQNDVANLPKIISQESIRELQKVLGEISVSNNQENILDIFDKERNFYINFITLISIVLSILGIAPVIYGIFEKNENVKLKEDLELIKDLYKTELEKQKIKNVFNIISDKTDGAFKGISFVFDDSTKVSSVNDLERFMRQMLEQILTSINMDLLVGDELRTFAFLINNFLLSILFYSNKYLGEDIRETNHKFKIIDIPVLKGICLQICSSISYEKFTQLRKHIEGFPDGKFDFTEL